MKLHKQNYQVVLMLAAFAHRRITCFVTFIIYAVVWATKITIVQFVICDPVWENRAYRLFKSIEKRRFYVFNVL